jgi:signal transduction histidine kinase
VTPFQRSESSLSGRRLGALITVHVVWLAIVFFIAGWWGYLLRSQADQIFALEERMGIAVGAAAETLARTHRMIFWESTVLGLLLVSATGVLIYVYRRDERRTRAIQSFFASLTHELRTPLTSIRLQAESISDRADNAHSETAHFKRNADRLLEDVTRMESQIEQSLELARLERGGSYFTQAVPLRSTLERTLESIAQGHLGALKISDQWGADCRSAEVHADPHALRIVLRNVFENAIRHAAPKTEPELVVSARRDSKRSRIIVGLESPSSRYTGDPGQLGRLFLKGPHSTGTGVGLYLVRTLMKQMRGDARFSQATGFLVELSFEEASS